MSRRIIIGVVVALFVIAGMIFVSAQYSGEEAEAPRVSKTSQPTCSQPAAKTCGASTCGGTCGGNCGIANCGCSK